MTTLTLKIEPDLKAKAQKIAEEIGISLSSLIKTLLRQTVRSGRIDIDTKLGYHTDPQTGDLVFKDIKTAVAFSKKLAENDDQVEKVLQEGL